MQSFKTSFGFDTVFIGEGSLAIYTCKVRLKINKLPKLAAPIRVTDKKNGLKEIAFEVADQALAFKLQKRVGKVLKEHAQNKLNAKYQWV